MQDQVRKVSEAMIWFGALFVILVLFNFALLLLLPTHHSIESKSAAAAQAIPCNQVNTAWCGK